VQQEDLRVLIVTLVSGLFIIGGGASLLFFAFRAFAEGKGGERRFVGLSIALVAFVFGCCAVIFMLSLR
jgi:hypothetical protein